MKWACKIELSTGAHFEVPRLACAESLRPQHASSMWSYGGWRPGGSRYFFSFADLESRFAKLLFVERPFCICSVLFSRPASLSPNSPAVRSWPSGLHLHLLFAAVAPGLQVGNFRSGSSLGAGVSLRGVPPGCGSRGGVTWAAEPLGFWACFGKARYLFPLSALLAGFFFFF